MAVDPLMTWKTTLAALPKTEDDSWAANFAAWYAQRIAGIEPDPASLVPTSFVFPFDEPTFASELQGLMPTPSALSGIQGFADAWETAILATLPTVQPGTFVPPPLPASTFSVVATTEIIAASIAAGKAKLLELVSAPTVADPLDSLFPEKFRDATLLLKIKVTGMDSTSPGDGGPLPLTADNVPLI